MATWDSCYLGDAGMAIGLSFGCTLRVMDSEFILSVALLPSCPNNVSSLPPYFPQGNTPPVVVNTDTLDGSPYVRIRSNLLFIV